MRNTSILCLAVLILTGGGRPADAQSLLEKLRSEPVEALAASARELGSPVRGAILFTQQNLSCTQCHAPTSGDPVGPDLKRPAADVNDVYLVESLLYPSKVIRQGFETSVVVTVDGMIFSGRIVRRTPDRIVLQVSTPEVRQVDLPESQIDEVQPSDLSTMPETLVDQLQNRGQFLDLVRYLIELAEAAHSPTAPLYHAGGGVVRQQLQGLALIKNLNCGACHANGLVQTQVTDNVAPDLTSSSVRIDAAYIGRWLMDPRRVKPGTTMPDVMEHLSDEQRKEATSELTHYLMSIGPGDAKKVDGDLAIDAESVARGRELFHTVGCVACHSPRDDAGHELLVESSVPLGTVDQKYQLAGLVQFLEDPLLTRPSGRMPNMRLTHWEALDLAKYLYHPNVSSEEDGARPAASTASGDSARTRAARESDAAASPGEDSTKPSGTKDSFVVDQRLAERGRGRFDQLGCRQCHTMGETKSEPVSVALSKLDPSRGCLSETVGEWPAFDLTSSQREAIKVALARPAEPLTTADQIALSITAFRCVNCHQRDELGGVSPERNPHFRTADQNLGPQGRLPPPLTGVGAKLEPTWMREVLVSGRAIRPYVLTRMPLFGTANVEHLVGLFQQTDQLPPVEFGELGDEKEIREAGAELVGTAGLNCIVCHTFQLKKSANMSAVDLTEMAERLQKSWFYHYMRDPQRLSQNTIMPSFWPGGRAMRTDILEGDANRQLEAIWQYLLEGRQARTPRGLIQEPIELLAADEAVMLRRSYQGIGKRGIGVGYPEQLNLVFDAEQLRLGMIWKGKFADPGGVWRSQGHGNVRPLGDHLIRFAAGPDLDDAKSPWVVDEGRPPSHHFKGYSLDEKMRPRFKYQFADVTVEDYLQDRLDATTGAPCFERTITLHPGLVPRELAFRAATGKEITKVEERVFLVDGQLRVVIDSSHEGKVVRSGDASNLSIPLSIDQDTDTLTIKYVW